MCVCVKTNVLLPRYNTVVLAAVRELLVRVWNVQETMLWKVASAFNYDLPKNNKGHFPRKNVPL